MLMRARSLLGDLYEKEPHRMQVNLADDGVLCCFYTYSLTLTQSRLRNHTFASSRPALFLYSISSAILAANDSTISRNGREGARR